MLGTLFLFFLHSRKILIAKNGTRKNWLKNQGTAGIYEIKILQIIVSGNDWLKLKTILKHLQNYQKQHKSKDVGG